MNYANIKNCDIANGEGVRVTLFVSGCTNHCENCFQPETWDFAYGQPFTGDTAEEILDALAPSYIRGFSVLGGEPLEPANRDTVWKLLQKVKETYPEKTIWLYSGYEYEKDLLCWEAEKDAATIGILSLIDVLVDGEFVEEKKNLRLSFRGSENQRLIDVKKTREQGQTVLLAGYR